MKRIRKCPRDDKLLDETVGMHLGFGYWMLRFVCAECGWTILTVGKPPREGGGK